MSQPVYDKKLFLSKEPNNQQNVQNYNSNTASPADRLRSMRNKILSTNVMNSNHCNNGSSSLSDTGIPLLENVSANLGKFVGEDIFRYQSLLIEYIKGINPTLELLNGFDVEGDEKGVNTTNGMDFKLLESIMTINSQPRVAPVDSHNVDMGLNSSELDMTRIGQKAFPNFDNLDNNMKTTYMSLIFDEYVWSNELLGRAYPSKYFSNANMKMYNIVEEIPWMSQNQQELKEVRKSIIISPPIMTDSLASCSTLPKIKRRLFLPPPELSLPEPLKIEAERIERPKRRQRLSSCQSDISTSSFVPFNALGSSRIELIKYSEIITPNWRKFESSQSSLHSTGCIFEKDEDLVDEAFRKRHSKLEVEEHNKYMLALKTGRRYKRRISVNVKNRSTKVDKSIQDPNPNLNINLYNEDCVSQFFT